MVRKSLLCTIAVATLLLSGCATSAAEPPQDAAPEASHTMPDGTVMSGAEHSEHGEHGEESEHGAAGDRDHAEHETEHGPSPAAQMICDGQVVAAVASTLKLDAEVSPSSSWSEPMFSCTYDIEGAPLELTVHDAADVETGQAHFDELQESLGAREIEGMLGLGMPSFTTDEGVVGFMRDGKTLLVDATALPGELAEGTMTRDEVAYSLASAVLVCWVEHD